MMAGLPRHGARRRAPMPHSPFRHLPLFRARGVAARLTARMRKARRALALVLSMIAMIPAAQATDPVVQPPVRSEPALHGILRAQGTGPFEDGTGPFGDEGDESVHAPARSPDAAADLWQRIRSGFAMTSVDSDEVRNGEDFYVSHPKYVQRIIERSRRYLFHIVEEVERRRMPTEIALLPIIESAFNPRAYSPSHASGIWQFIPSTAKNHGLKQSWWRDERRDIIAATRAALDYLQTLYGMFGDWELALASYNWGEGAVARSLTRNRDSGLPADFRSISLPPETQNYVSRLIAIRNIISNPAMFGIELESVPNHPYFGEVAATRHMDVRLAAKLASISVDEFRALNPAHNRPVINVSESRSVLLPIDKVDTFLENLRNHEAALVSWRLYRVERPEHAEAIAARHGISTRRLKEVNDLYGNGAIPPGQLLLVPSGNGTDDGDISMMNDRLAMPGTSERTVVHTVAKGDALSTIARRYGVTVSQLRTWNRTTERLRIGQTLRIKQSRFAGTPPVAAEALRLHRSTPNPRM
ncbi:membrane-bound lytic murein transglycosylase D [Nitrosovibrio sp. Nv17]|nr:membrane-bound lytic murein transglycosylase D [Nitrosovibrio sp. Nv17]